MWHNIWNGIFNSGTTSNITISQFLLCILASLIVGFILAFAFSLKGSSSKSFITTLATLPAIVCMVIMMVNGNIGTGVAVAGTFSLVKFRSIPGTAKEIGSIFLAMGAGLMVGMGYIAYSILFTVIISLVTILYSSVSFGETRRLKDRMVAITIPEDLNYTDIFTDLFSKYTEKTSLEKVKTTNMGSLYKLTYRVTMKDPAKEKEFIDEIRCRNGNLEISISPVQNSNTEL